MSNYLTKRALLPGVLLLLSYQASAESLRDYRPNSANFPPPLRGNAQALAQAGENADSIRAAIGELRDLHAGRGMEDEKYFLLGYGEFKLGEYENSITSLRKSLEIRESNAEAHYLLALAALKKGDCESALKEVKSFEWLAGTGLADALTLRAECLQKLNRTEEAGVIFAELTKRAQTDPEIRKFLLKAKSAEITAGGIDPSTLGVDIREAALNNPEDKGAQSLYAKSLFKKGDPLFATKELLEAEELYRAMLKSSTLKDEATVKALFDVYLKKRDFQSAEELLDQATQALPNSEIYRRAQKQLEIETTGLSNLRYGSER